MLADGKILDTLDAHRKDNTGYDLKQLFIGGEGTLGIITDAAVLCYPQPACTSLCMISLAAFDSVKKVLVEVCGLLRSRNVGEKVLRQQSVRDRDDGEHMLRNGGEERGAGPRALRRRSLPILHGDRDAPQWEADGGK